MQKIAFITLLVLGMIFTSCSQIPFQAKKPSKNTALVYVYSLANGSISDTDTDSKYKLFINGRSTNGVLEEHAYNTYDFKAVSITLSMTRQYLERKNISLTLKAGKVYYVRVQTNSNRFADFDFEVVDETTALQELKETHLSGKYEKSDSIIGSLLGSSEDKNDELMQKDKVNTGAKLSESEINAMIDKRMEALRGTSTSTSSSTKVIQTGTSSGSKLNDLRNAYEMKKQGMLTNEEFKAMKAEILSK
ncbi:DUF2846 domain-containing protein [Sulfurimonas sp. SAG-AH-194-I05]|nr:DUF2846 domain-containing protein [Sulfurimonas sp. SAG-AH-194-I05]MDF1874169.1 DUF2846 domain-containing protein [Sulfurimonas sp. SAG-AH-194-I05]